MTGVELNRLLNLEAEHALYREDGSWFHHLKRFPGVLIDKYGYIKVKSKKEYLENTHFQHGIELHVKNGISKLKGYTKFSRREIGLLATGSSSHVDEETIRIIREVGVIKRNQSLVKRVKKLYKDTCQICRTRLKIRKGVFYSEVHHIKSLGSPHNGPDKIENMMCVCPNHHILLDFGAIAIKLKTFALLKHKINEEFVLHHNRNIWYRRR